MDTFKNNELLDFLAECFLQQGASVTYTTVGAASALKVLREDELLRIFVSAEDKVSKMSLLKRNSSEEIIIPVLKSEEDFRLKSLLRRAGIKGIEVQRLSIL